MIYIYICYSLYDNIHQGVIINLLSKLKSSLPYSSCRHRKIVTFRYRSDFFFFFFQRKLFYLRLRLRLICLFELILGRSKTYLAIKGTCVACVYSSVAIFVASDIFRQSINQKRADTVVVKETQSFTNVNGVEPVTSSQTARD